MIMVRKTAKQFYIKKYSLSDVGIFLFSHPVARALSSALQGLTSVFGNSGLRKAPLFGERTSDGAIRERIARSALNERSPRGRGVDPLRHQHQLLIMRFFFRLPRLGLTKAEVNRKKEPHYRMLASSYLHTPSPEHYFRHYRA